LYCTQLLLLLLQPTAGRIPRLCNATAAADPSWCAALYSCCSASLLLDRLPLLQQQLLLVMAPFFKRRHWRVARSCCCCCRGQLP
jgi:hypothetical protein